MPRVASQALSPEERLALSVTRGGSGGNPASRPAFKGARGQLTDAQAYELLVHLVDPHGHQSERVAQEQLWLRTLAYFAGKQHFIQDGIQLREPINVPEHRVMYKTNLMQPAIVRAVSKIMTLGFDFTAAPVSDSPRDRYAAKFSERALEHLHHTTDHDYTRMMVLQWAAICGSGFTFVAWDPEAGDPDRYYLEDMHSRKVQLGLSDPEKREKEIKGLFVDYPPGEVTEKTESPFTVYHDWSSRDQGVKGCKFMAVVSYLDVDTVAELYDMDPNDVPREEARLGPIFYEEAIAFMSTGIGGLNPSIPTPREKYQERARVTQYFERPNRANSFQGRHIVTVGGIVVRNQQNYYRATGYPIPIVKWDWIHMPGRFWGIGLGEQLTSPQFQLNKARATLMEFQNIYGHPALFVPEGSGLPTGQFTIAPGAVYSYNPAAGKIETGPTPQLPREVAENAMMCEADIQKISANVDPDVSKLPAQIRSGAGLKAMMEEKHLALTPVALSAIKSERDTGKMMLALARINYTTTRTLRYVGDNGHWTVKEYLGADLNSDLRIVTEPIRFQSAAQIQAETLDMVESGLLDVMNNPEHRASALRSVHFKTGRDVMAEMVVEEQNQDREIEEVLADPARFIVQGLPINQWDDHPSHERTLRRFMRSDRWRQTDKISQAIIARHWAEHMQQIQMAQQRALEAQNAAKGTPGQKGQPSRPKVTA